MRWRTGLLVGLAGLVVCLSSSTEGMAKRSDCSGRQGRNVGDRIDFGSGSRVQRKPRTNHKTPDKRSPLVNEPVRSQSALAARASTTVDGDELTAGQRAGQELTSGLGPGSRRASLSDSKQGAPSVLAARAESTSQGGAGLISHAGSVRAGNRSGDLGSGSRIQRGRSFGLPVLAAGGRTNMRAWQPYRADPMAGRTFAGRPCTGCNGIPVPAGGYRKQPPEGGCCGKYCGGPTYQTSNRFGCPWMELYDGPVEVAKHWWEGPVARDPVPLNQFFRSELEKSSPSTLERIDKRQRLSLADVRELSRAGLPKDVIIDQLRSTGTCYHLTNQQVFQLQHWMVNPDVIEYLQFCSGER